MNQQRLKTHRYANAERKTKEPHKSQEKKLKGVWLKWTTGNKLRPDKNLIFVRPNAERERKKRFILMVGKKWVGG